MSMDFPAGFYLDQNTDFLSPPAKSNLRCASKLADQVLCLPIYPALKSEDQQRIIEVIQAI